MSVNNFTSSEFVSNMVDNHFTQDVDEDITDNLSPHFAAIDKCFGGNVSMEDIRGSVTAVAGEGGPSSAWAKETLAMLDTTSPTSCAVTLEQMKKGAALKDLGQCLQMEFRMARHFLSQPDFFEGVRANLIAKDRNPKWQPAPTEPQVEEYFQKLPVEEELMLPVYTKKAPAAAAAKSAGAAGAQSAGHAQPRR